MRQLGWKDYAIAAFAGALLTISPFTPPHLLPSALMGLALALGVILYLGLATRAPALDTAPPLPSGPGTSPISWVAVAVFALLTVPIFQFMFERWTTSVWVNSHGLFVPFAMAYLGWDILRKDPDPDPDSSPWGFAFLLPGLALIGLDLGLKTGYVASIGLVLCLPGLCLLLLGRRRTSLLTLPLVLSLFLIPIPVTAGTHLFLRDVTSWGVEWMMTPTGVHYFREGTRFTMTSGVFIVSDVCSGFSTTYASFAVALGLVAFAKTPLRKIVLLLAAGPLAIFCNILRVTALLLLSHRFGTEVIIDTAIHPASGVAVFWIVLVSLWALAGMRQAEPAAA